MVFANVALVYVILCLASNPQLRHSLSHLLPWCSIFGFWFLASTGKFELSNSLNFNQLQRLAFFHFLRLVVNIASAFSTAGFSIPSRHGFVPLSILLYSKMAHTSPPDAVLYALHTLNASGLPRCRDLMAWKVLFPYSSMCLVILRSHNRHQVAYKVYQRFMPRCMGAWGSSYHACHNRGFNTVFFFCEWRICPRLKYWTSIMMSRGLPTECLPVIK